MSIKNCLLSLFCWLSLLGLLHGQQNVVVLSTSTGDGITYQPKEGETRNVFAGLRLLPQGTLNIQVGGIVNLVVDGKKVSLAGPKVIKVTQLPQLVENTGSSSFLSRFWNFISSSVTNTGNSKDVEAYHRQYLTNTKAGIEGYGELDRPIQLPWYLSRSIGTELLPLHWTAIEGATQYTLELTSKYGNQTVLNALTKSNHFTLNLAELSLVEGAAYELNISTEVEGKLVNSPAILISYDPEGVEKFLAKQREKRVFQTLEPNEQELFLLDALETEGYLEPAFRAYQQLIAQEPDNQLYQRLYIAFLVRMNDTEEAKKILATARFED